MAPEFHKEDHALRRLRVAELGGLVFGTFSDATPDLETWLGPDVTRGLLRVMNRTPHVLGRSTQVLPNNWKLYFENVKDTYHASILHLFLTTFKINKLTMPGGIYINQRRQQRTTPTPCWTSPRRAQDYKDASLRSDSEFRLQDNSVVDSVDEYGDGVSVQILTILPATVLQQVRNTIAVRVIRPRGVDRTELEWIHLGFDTDDAAMTERRLRQGNLIGPPATSPWKTAASAASCNARCNTTTMAPASVMMGGHEAESQKVPRQRGGDSRLLETLPVLMGE